jgi:hypothetical protein
MTWLREPVKANIRRPKPFDGLSSLSLQELFAARFEVL